MRILIKISGEALSQKISFPVDLDYLRKIGLEIKTLVDSGLEIAIVCGGGNICRGALFAEKWISPNVWHAIGGALATAINGLFIQDVLTTLWQATELYTAREISSIGKIFDAKKATTDLKNNTVAILTGGTGNPYFTTDTAAVLRSIELGCDMMIKCTSVDGIYSADPKEDSSAKRYETVSYDEVLAKNLRIMDQAAIALAREHNVRIGVCHIDTLASLTRLKDGKFEWSIIQK